MRAPPHYKVQPTVYFAIHALVQYSGRDIYPYMAHVVPFAFDMLTVYYCYSPEHCHVFCTTVDTSTIFVYSPAYSHWTVCHLNLGFGLTLSNTACRHPRAGVKEVAQF